MISLLLPCRRDSLLLPGFVESMLENTSDMNNVELLVSLSDNDTWCKSYLDRLNHSRIKYFTQPKPYGRFGLHDYMNLLCEHSKGKLLWHMCDDYRLVTKGWDLILKEYESYSDKVYSLYPCPSPDYKIAGFASPIITRKWYNTLNHWALFYSVDSWIGEVACSYLPRDKQINIPELDLKDLSYCDLYIPREDMDSIKFIDFPWEDPRVREWIREDADLLLEEIKNERPQ